jgi:hypothetical protein
MRWPTGTAGGLDSELVVATAQVLDEGVASDHDARRSLGLQSAHRPEPCLQAAVVALDPVVLVLVFSSWPVLCQAAGTRASTTFAKAGARSVITSGGPP